MLLLPPVQSDAGPYATSKLTQFQHLRIRVALDHFWAVPGHFGGATFGQIGLVPADCVLTSAKVAMLAQVRPASNKFGPRSAKRELASSHLAGVGRTLGCFRPNLGHTSRGKEPGQQNCSQNEERKLAGAIPGRRRAQLDQSGPNFDQVWPTSDRRWRGLAQTGLRCTKLAQMLDQIGRVLAQTGRASPPGPGNGSPASISRVFSQLLSRGPSGGESSREHVSRTLPRRPPRAPRRFFVQQLLRTLRRVEIWGLAAGLRRQGTSFDAASV